MKLKLFLTILFFNLSIYTFCQNPDWDWAKAYGGTNMDKGHSISGDSLGNVYVCGTFRNEINFDGINLPYGDANNNFVAKFSSSGETQWVKVIGVTPFSDLLSIKVGKDIVFVSGYLNDTVSMEETILGIAGQSSAFLIALNLDGELLWGKTIRRASGITFGATENDEITFACTYSDSMVIDSESYYGESGTNGSLFFMDNQGNVLWNRRFGTNNFFSVNSIAVRSNKIALTGKFSDSIHFDGTHFYPVNSKAMFVTLYDKEGTFMWTKLSSSFVSCSGNDVAIDAQDNIYVCGTHHQSTEFSGQVIQGGPNGTGFFIKYDSNGELIWVHSLEQGTNGANRIKIDREHGVYVAGHFFGTLNFENFSATANPTGMVSIFLLKVDENGDPFWMMKCTTANSGANILNDMVIAENAIYFTGYLSGQHIFFGTHEIDSHGGDDIFLAKLNNVLGLEEQAMDESFICYPNPVQHGESLVFNSQKPICVLTFFDQSGKLVLNTSVKGTKADLLQLNPGLYLVDLMTEEGQVYHSKLLIE